MSVRLLYGITPAGTVTSSAGLEGRPLRAVVAGPLQAVCSDHGAPPPSNAGALWSYEATLERLMAQAPVVPARFGTVAADDAELTEMLTSRREELLATLERVRGAVELAVHPAPVDAESDPPRNGTEYLQSRLRARRALDALDAATAGLYRERADAASRSAGYLVPAGDVERFIAAAAAAGATVTGPWPPFSFVA